MAILFIFVAVGVIIAIHLILKAVFMMETTQLLKVCLNSFCPTFVHLQNLIIKPRFVTNSLKDLNIII